MSDEGVLLFSNPDFANAFIGVTVTGDLRAVYDYDLMVQDLMREDKISDIDAIEFIEYNSLYEQTIDGLKSPVVIRNFKDMLSVVDTEEG